MGFDDQFIVMDRKAFDGLMQILENNNYSHEVKFYSIGQRYRLDIKTADDDFVFQEEINIFTKGVF